jgi:MFS family permease
MRKLSASNTVLLIIICLMYLILYVDRVNISTAAPLIKADLDLNNTQLGLAFSAFAYPYALFQLVGGYGGDKLGPRLTLIVCALIVCAATAATGAVGGLAGLFTARLALGIGEGATLPTATRAMAVWIPERRWAFAQGITHSFARIGNALTPPLIVMLIELVSWRGSFVVLALLSLIWVLVWAWYFRDVPEALPLTTEELATLPARSRRGASESVPWLRLFRRMLPVTAVDFCYGWTLWLFLSWIPSFFYQYYHQDLRQSAFYSASVFLAGVIGDTLGGLVSDNILHRTGDRAAARRNVIVVGMLGGFLFLMPVMLVHDVKVAAISLAAAFFFVELVVAPLWAVPMDIAPKYFRIRQRHDEFRLRSRRHRLALRLRLPNRSHGELGPAVLRLDFPLAAWHRPGVPNAPGSAVRAGRGRAGHRVIIAPRYERSPQATHCCAVRTSEALRKRWFWLSRGFFLFWAASSNYCCVGCGGDPRHEGGVCLRVGPYAGGARS